jgi:predicted GNAT family acetyltransferase
VTETALEYAKGKSMRVIPMCSYVGAYIRRHPEYIELTKQHATE